MPFATTPDGVRLRYAESGSGAPILFIHEFATDSRGWEPQVAHFSRTHRCIVYDARGYPPSDVPDDPAAYSQRTAVADAIAVLDELDVPQAHVVGISMGGFCALHLGLLHPERARSLVVAGCGYGAAPEARAGFRRESQAVAAAFRADGSAAVAEWYAVGPARVQFQNKDPEGWARFAARLAEHSPLGAELTMLGVQCERPSLYDLTDELRALTVPTLIVVGDEDDGCLEADLMLKRTIDTAGLAVLPRTGHTCNLEEPDLFNGAVARFLEAVEDGRWTPRDPRSRRGGVVGMGGEEPAAAAR